MDDKIKVVYSWIGPRGPIWNTELPNLLSFAAASEQCSINSHNWWSDDAWLTLFSHASDQYEVYPSFNIDCEDDRFFIYPFSLAWRIPFESYFMGNTGILEFAHMPGHLIRLVREKNGYILINHSVEAFMGPGYLSSLHSYFSNTHGIPLHKIIYVTGCINSAELYERYCNDNNIPEGKEHRLTIISYPSSQTIFRPNLEESEAVVYDTELVPNRLFLSWNRRYRNHRVTLALMLESLNLIDRTYISFSDVNIERQTKTFEQSIHYHVLQNWGVDISQETINSFASRLPLTIDNETNINQMCEDRGNVSRPYYQDSLVSLITETNFDNDEVTLTEKSYKPIKEKHPFIIIGVNGAVKGLQRAGFRTFNEFWDEGYDEITCPAERIRAIKKIIEDISTWDNDKILDFKRKVKPILEYNYDVLKESSPRQMALEINNKIRGSNA
jgi:hypothetical protein